jgi:hypothetical protein
MKCGTTNSNAPDLLSNPLLAFVVFCLPAIAMGRDRVLSGWRRLANSGVDRGPEHNGNSVLGQCGSLRTGALLHYRTFPSRDGDCHFAVRSWRPAAGWEWLERNRSDHSDRCHRPELPVGDVLWEISDRSRQERRSRMSSRGTAPKPKRQSRKPYFITPRCAIPMLSREVFFTRYIISSACRIISCGVFAS